MQAPIVTIRSLHEYVGQEVTIQGWCYAKTGKGKLVFCRCATALASVRR
jgi:aspartyl-tRNA synthetase